MDAAGFSVFHQILMDSWTSVDLIAFFVEVANLLQQPNVFNLSL